MPDQLFSSGFESPAYVSDGWDSVVETGPNQTLRTAPQASRSGTRGSRATMNSTGAEQNHEAKVVKLIPDTPNQKAYAQAWVRLVSITQVGFGAAGSKSVLTLRAVDGQPLVWLSLRSGGVRLSYMQRNNNVATINSFVPIAIGSWYGFRLLLDRSGFRPYIEGWITTDGVTWTTLGSMVGLDTGAGGVAKRPGSVDVGIAHITNFENGVYTIDHDDVEIGHSLGTGTDWSSMFVTPIRLKAALGGVGEWTGTAEGGAHGLSDIRFVQEREGRFVVSGTVAGQSEGERTAPGLVVGFISHTRVMQAQVEKLGTADGAVRLARVGLDLDSGVAEGGGRLGFWLISRTLTEPGIPTAATTSKLSAQAWGAAVTSDEAHGSAVASDQPLGVAVVSDERG